MRRGEVWWADIPPPTGSRPVVVVSRDEACRVRNQVTVAMVTTRRRGVATEVDLGAREGLDRACVVNADTLRTVPKAWLLRRLGEVGPEKRPRMDDALRFALGLPRLHARS
jgi:mRNA interferase MazF